MQSRCRAGAEVVQSRCSNRGAVTEVQKCQGAGVEVLVQSDVVWQRCSYYRGGAAKRC